MTIYGISGLGADERVFQHIKFSERIKPIRWIKPEGDESIESYSLRLSEQIIDDEFILIAVSFGGLIAIEMNKILKPKLTILISSANTKYNLRFIYRAIGKTGLIKLIPKFFLSPPESLMYWLFGAKNKKLLRTIIIDTDLEFTKWAIYQITKWKNEETFKNVIKIHGKNDKLIPYVPDSNTIAVQNGEHFMIVDKAQEISEILERLIKKNNIGKF